MRNQSPRYLHSIPIPDPDDPDGNAPLPVEPDEGLVPADIPDDPEYDRVVEPMD